jgi:RimJ/RimL family protein N-acetyltransferase
MAKHKSFSLTRGVLLRDVTEADLPTFFEQQRDPDASRMAAFTQEYPTDRDAFMAHWTRIMGEDAVTIKTILFNGQIVGYVLSYPWLDKPQIGYWIGREYWGKGIATTALAKLLREVKVRPLYARAAKDNVASLRVMEKCGFTVVGEEKSFANARGQEVEELLLELR